MDEYAVDGRLAEEQPASQNCCAKCGKAEFEEGYLTRLCSDCRTELSKYPLPGWLKGFGAGIAVFVIIGLFFISKPLTAAIHLARANKFMEQHKYQSAARELSQVTAYYPDKVDINTKAFIAFGHCYETDSVGYYYNKIADKRLVDNDLLSEANTMLDDYAVLMLADTTLSSVVAEKKAGPIEVFNQFATAYMDSNPDDLSAKTYLAGTYSDMGMDQKAETILMDVIERKPLSLAAYLSIVPIKRDLGKLDEADDYVDKLLAINQEDAIALSHKARIALKRKNDTAAALYAQKASALQPKNSRSLTTQALVHHFAGRPDSSKQYMALVKTVELQETNGTDSGSYMWADSIITGKKIFR